MIFKRQTLRMKRNIVLDECAGISNKEQVNKKLFFL